MEYRSVLNIIGTKSDNDSLSNGVTKKSLSVHAVHVGTMKIKPLSAVCNNTLSNIVRFPNAILSMQWKNVGHMLLMKYSYKSYGAVKTYLGGRAFENIWVITLHGNERYV